MNRIYQGRVSTLELLSSLKDPEVIEAFEREAIEDQSRSPLWEHHEIFSDAIGYYMVALAALAYGSPEGTSRLVGDLIARMKASWEKFPRDLPGHHHAKSLRDSVRTWLDLPVDATLAEAFETILSGNEADPQTRFFSLALLLDKCGGESAIQQAGRGYFPRFCDAEAKPTYDYSPRALKAASGKEELAAILHSDPAVEDLADLARRMDLSWTVKVTPGAFFVGEEARNRLVEAVDHYRKEAKEPTNARIEEFFKVRGVGEEKFERFREGILSLPDEVEIPRNRKASKDLTFATLLFQFFPSDFTAGLLMLFVAEPKGNADESEEFDFASLGDDPIKLARGERGWVFPAFTTLKGWKPQRDGEPVWKEFDIAAFKEALKGFSQFSQKTDDRQDEGDYLRGKLAILLGSKVDGWKPRKSESGEETENIESLDGDLLLLAQQLEEQLTEELPDTVVDRENAKTLEFGEAIYKVVPGAWQISGASLRGFRDIAAKWNQLMNRKSKPSEKDLQDEVKAYQKDEKNKKSVGSVPLLLILCEEKYHPLWRDVEVEDSDEPRSNRFLYQMADLHYTFRDFIRTREPINLTPAEPRHSRRLYMFSDLKDKLAKVRIEEKEDGVFLDCGLARKATDGFVFECRARLHFTAPRLRRDGLLGGGDSGWLQPMTKALGLEAPESEGTFESAVSLMPDFGQGGNLRMLLNFPKTLDPGWIHDGLGKAAVWTGQFNGIKGKNLHLHWPGTGSTTAYKKSPWLDNPGALRDGFTILSVDVGQRTAGAWALLRITAFDPRTRETTKRPVRSIGHDGKREWFAEILKTGMFRLPGEDQKVRGDDGKLHPEHYGKAGRNALEFEYQQAKHLAGQLLATEPKKWVGETATAKSFPEQNDSLLRLARNRLSRLNTFHRWSCFSKNLEIFEENSARRGNIIRRQGEELSQWSDKEVVAWKVVFDSQDFSEFSRLAGVKFDQYRADLEPLLVELANRVCPLRRETWEWKRHEQPNSQGICYGELVREPHKHGKIPWIRGQRGLSMERLEQLESLRGLFLRYNRSFDKEPGSPSKVGFGFSHLPGEPCDLLLRKLDRMKEERVNQTAHLILANALGVRLTGPSEPKSKRIANDIHGEYEKIEGRDPVDFIVIENLDRYLTSQGRAPSENRRLMKWAHRAVRDKLKMLAEESFGIPVVEAPAPYSSRFCALTAQAGTRCAERPSLDKFHSDLFEKKANATPGKGGWDQRSAYRKLCEQFEKLEEINAEREARKKPLRTLVVPKPGGPLFLPANSGGLSQADANAAINIGLRAVAAPSALDIIHKVRTVKKKSDLAPRRDNKREKEAFSATTVIEPKGELKPSRNATPNFFFDGEKVAEFDRADIAIGSGKGSRNVPIASSLGIFSAVNRKTMERIIAINAGRLSKWDKGDQIPHL